MFQMARKRQKAPELGDIIISLLYFIVVIFLVLYSLSGAKSLVSCFANITDPSGCSYSTIHAQTVSILVVFFAAWLVWRLKKSGLV